MSKIQICTDKHAWDDYILDNGGHPLQLWGWGQVKAGNGWKAERYFFVDDEVVVGAAQVLIRPLPAPFMSFAYVPRGPVLNDMTRTDEFLGHAAALLKKSHRVLALSVEPPSRECTLGTKWRRSKNRILSNETILLNLTLSDSDLLATMAKKTRQYIRKSASDGVSVKRVRSEEDVAACLEIYQKTAQRAGFNLHSEKYYRDVLQLMGDHSPIFAAYVDGEVVAFLWLGVSAQTAYELYGGMNEVGQRLRANYALKWFVIRKMKEWGLSEYDFGGLVAGGVSVFKQGWTDTPTLLAGTYDLPLSPLYPLWARVLPLAKNLAQKLRRRS
jgi:peptidoglycan pentaglycine glycine transferase (the first glycine)